MAKSDIAMWVVSFIILVLVGLAVTPSLTSSGTTARIAVINSEIGTIRNASMLWVAQNSPNGDFTGISATGVATQLPALTLATNKFQSKVNPGITYTIAPKSGDASQVTITIDGLGLVTGAEASVKTSQTANSTLITDTVATDGTLVIDFRG